MRIAGRFALGLLILGGLAFGSYAFGRFVLSNQLFGTASDQQDRLAAGRTQTVAPPVTRQIELKGTRPRVEVEVLPADEADPGPEPPDLRAMNQRPRVRPTSDPGMEQAQPTPTPDAETGRRTRHLENNPLDFSLGSDDEGTRPRRRRRRRRPTTTNDAPASTTTRTEAQAGSEGTAGESVIPRPESSGGDTGSSDSSGSSSREAPRREAPRREVPRREAPRRETPRRETPRDSGGSSGESPIPVPG